MFNNIWDWLNPAITLASFVLTLWSLAHARRRRCERYRSFKGFGIEWTRYDRDDRQS
jgi:hypothetical protein